MYRFTQPVPTSLPVCVADYFVTQHPGITCLVEVWVIRTDLSLEMVSVREVVVVLFTVVTLEHLKLNS